LSDGFLLTILVLGLSTYATRLAGYWLLRGREVSGRFKAALDAVPPAILVAVIAPSVLLQGKAEMLAGALTLALALLRVPLLLTIIGGVISIGLLRLFI
jgi:uncharacterized membrane protein